MSSVPLSSLSTHEITDAYAAALSSFVPEIVKHALDKKKQIKTPYCETFYSAALFADVSGFTAMTEMLAAKGNIGTEELPHHINSYLGQIVRRIVGYGGDVVKFAGDALLCVWPPNPEHWNDPVAQQEDLKTSVHLAAKCALDVQKEYGTMRLAGAAQDSSKKSQTKECELRVKLGIGAGKCSLLIVGGEMNRCEYLVAGEALLQAFACESDCIPGQVIISPDALKYVESVVKCKPVDSSKYKNSQVLQARGVHKGHYQKLAVTRELAMKMKGYIPSAVRPHLEMPSTIWTGELREVTILFISLPFTAKRLVDIDDQKKGAALLSALQLSIVTLQKTIYHYQGSLNKFLVDDKGSTVMAVFGLPPVAHANDATRAVLAALELQRQFKKQTKHSTAALGITSGIVFSGLIGSGGSRREYTVLGDKVNLAARLMGLAKMNPDKLGQVIVDSSVYHKAKTEVRIIWNGLGETHVKGKAEGVEIFRPVRANYQITVYKIGAAKNLETCDRSAIHVCSTALNMMIMEKEPQLIFIEGEISLGKSSLLAQVQVQNNLKCWFLWGKGDCFHALHPINYMVWRQITLAFSQRLAMSLVKNRFKFRTFVKKRRPDLDKFLFLLGDIVDLGLDLEVPFHYNEQIVRNTSKGKLVLYRHDIVIALFEWAARIKPIAIVVDEMQLLDIRDWQLTRRLCYLIHRRKVKNLSVLIGSYPMDNPRYMPHFTPQKIVQQYCEMRDFADVTVNPAPWGLSKTRFFINSTLGVSGCSGRLAESIYSECGGRPGFCDKFLRDLCESNQEWLQTLVSKKDKSHKIVTFNEQIEDKLKLGVDVHFPIPSFIQSVTAAHLDCISTEEFLCLKCAAVLCKAKGNSAKQFEEELVRGCHPVASFGERKRLRRTMKNLVDMNFIRKINQTSQGLAHAATIRHTIEDSMMSPMSPTTAAIVTSTTANAISTSAILSGTSSLSTASNAVNTTMSPRDPEQDNPNHVDKTHFDGITDPMPSTASLLQQPSANIPYKKGRLFKRGVRFLNMSEKERFFIFKHHTLYWLKDTQKEKYPVNRIKFDDTVEKLKREDNFCVKVKTPRKHYILRAEKKEDMDEWFTLFTAAMHGAIHVPTTINVVGGAPAPVINTPSLPSAATFDSDFGNSPSDYIKEVNPNTATTVPNTVALAGGNPGPKGNGLDKDFEVIMEDDEGESKSGSGNGTDKYTTSEQDETDHMIMEAFGGKKSIIVAPRKETSESVAGAPDDDDGPPPGVQRMRSLSSEDELRPAVDYSSGSDDISDDESEAEDGIYEFAFGFLRDVIYEQMLHSQRQQLHMAANKYIEKVLSLSYDHTLALLQSRHQEYAIDIEKMQKKDEDLFNTHGKLKKKRQSKFMRNMVIQPS